MEFIIPLGSQSTKVLAIYRPPYSELHRVTTSTFFKESGEHLSDLAVSSCRVLICGDFNIPVNENSSTDTKRLCDILNATGFHQHVSGMTHRLGNTLDLVITRNSDSILSHEPKIHDFISDHAAICCELKISCPLPCVKRVKYRKLKNIDKDNFKLEVASMFRSDYGSKNLSDLVDDYQNKFINLMDKVAPEVTKLIRVRHRQPWYNDQIKNEKVKLRKSERRWRQSGNKANYVVFMH